jgi:hypothetical protein
MEGAPAGSAVGSAAPAVPAASMHTAITLIHLNDIMLFTALGILWDVKFMHRM